MLLAFVMAVVLAVVCFKLGVYSVLLALFQLVAKVLFFGTGRFQLMYAGRWIVQQRRAQPVRPSPGGTGAGERRPGGRDRDRLPTSR